MESQFWSLIVEGGKVSPAELPDDLSLNISNAVLVNGNEKATSLFVKVLERDVEDEEGEEEEKNQEKKLYLCHLSNNSTVQFSLDLCFNGVSTKEVSFGVEGHGEIHLSGFLSENPMDEDFEGFEDDEDIGSMTSEEIAQKIKAMGEHGKDSDDDSDDSDDGSDQDSQPMKKIKGGEGKPIAKQPPQQGGKPAPKHAPQQGGKPAPKHAPQGGKPAPKHAPQQGGKPSPKQGF